MYRARNCEEHGTDVFFQLSETSIYDESYD